MFRPVSKIKRRLESNKAIYVLEHAREGIISTIGIDGYPYGVAVNYVYLDGAIYFHSSNKGHKIDNIKYNNKVSFFVSNDIRIIPEKFTTYYESVVVFGKAYIANDEDKRKALIAIGEKYSMGFMNEGIKSIDKLFKACTVIKINIDNISGKYSDGNN